MHKRPHIRESFVIQVRGSPFNSDHQASSSITPNFSAMKLFNRFRKIITRLVFPGFTSRGRTSAATTGTRSSSSRSRRNSCDKPEPPKSSFSSYYSSHSHYNEAIADCIEFFNKSSQDGLVLDGRRSSFDDMV